jgi:uncharacterized protein
MAEKHKHIWSARIVIFIVALFISTVMHFGGQQSVFAQDSASGSFPKTGEWAVGNGHYRLELALSANGSSASLTALSPAARDGVCEEPTVDAENYVEFYCRNQFYRLKISGTLPVLSAGAFGTFDFREDENYQAAMVEIEKQAAEKKRKDEEKRQVAKAEEQKAEQRKKEEVRLAAEAVRKKQEAEEAAKKARVAAELKRKQEREQARIAAEEEQKRREEEKRNKLVEARKNGKTIEQLLGADGRIAIQTALKMEGLLHDKADGVFGGNTRKALKAYQSKKGTLKTGYLTADEAAELREIAKSSTEFLAEEEERKLKAAELKKKREETKKRLVAETKRKREEENARKAAEAELKAEEERIAAEQEKVRKDEETRKIAEVKKRRKEMRKRLAAEARQKRKAEKAKKAADAEAKRAVAEETKRIAKEKTELAIEEERKRKARLRKKAKQELKRKLAAYREAPETNPIFKGDDDDVVFLLNESDRPLNAIRNLKGDVVFEDGKADVCRVKKLTLDTDYKVALLDELGGKGIKEFTKGFAATACGSLEKSEADLVVFRRGVFLNSKFEDAEAVLMQLQSQEFTIFYTSSSAAYKAEIASRGGEAREVQAGVMSGSLKGFGLLILDNKAKGVCAVESGNQKTDTNMIGTLKKELSKELLSVVVPIKFGNLNRTFISLKRKKCRFFFANSENLKTVHAALKRDRITSAFHHQWIDEAITEDATSKNRVIKKKTEDTEIAFEQERKVEKAHKEAELKRKREETKKRLAEEARLAAEAERKKEEALIAAEQEKLRKAEEKKAANEKEKRIAAEQADSEAGKKAYESGKWSDALSILLPLAEGGEANAQLYMGYMFQNGRAVNQSYKKAFVWFAKSAEMGNAEAQYNLSMSYGHGAGVKKDLQRFVAGLHQAAQSGSSYAQNMLGTVYFNGIYVKKNTDKSFDWHLRAAEQSLSMSQIAVGQFYEDGDLGQINLPKALHWYRRATKEWKPLFKGLYVVSDPKMKDFAAGKVNLLGDAEQKNRKQQALADRGDPKAQFFIGNLYSSGEWVKKDDVAAVKWYRKAAEQGNASAQTELGSMYSGGVGIAQDDKEAVTWLRKAAEQGKDTAADFLYIIYEYSLIDKKEAVKWLRKGAELGSEVAQNELARRYAIGEGVVQNYEKSLEWYRKAKNEKDAESLLSKIRLEKEELEKAKTGSASDKFKLAEKFQKGTGRLKDINKAIKWYEKSAEQGSVQAQANLWRIYADGVGIMSDYVKAYMWAAIAGVNGFERAGTMRMMVESKMSAEQIEKSKKMARQWLKKYSKI